MKRRADERNEDIQLEKERRGERKRKRKKAIIGITARIKPAIA